LLKEKITNAPVLQPFSLNKQTVLTVDASQKCLGAVLSQDSHPVLFISKTLSKTERNYSNIEREALAAVWACKRLSTFLLGKRFTLETDNKPLSHIFDSQNALKYDVSPRLMRLATKMMKFDYQIKHISGSKNTIADALSRINSIDTTKLPSINFFTPTIEIHKMQRETNLDRFLVNIRKRIINGNWHQPSPREVPFKRISFKLTIDENDLVRYGDRIVPPQSMYREIFDNAHQSHNGMQSTMKLISQEFYWPHMWHTVQGMVRGCEVCRSSRFNAPDNTHRWPTENNTWSRVHIDWAYCRGQGNLLIIADAYSGWLEAILCKNRETTTVVNCLRSIFARFGIPPTLVSDNAPEFTSAHFHQWLTSIGCRVVHTPEYHPQSNGLAERMVRVLKDGVAYFNPTKCSFQEFVHRLLLVHRNSSNRNGKTPAELMFGRKLRCPILSNYQPSQRLLYKAHAKAPSQPVTMLFRKGENTSLIAHKGGRTVLAHDSQLVAEPQVNLPTARSKRSRRGSSIKTYRSGKSIPRPKRTPKPVRRYPDVDPKSEGRKETNNINLI